MRVGSGAPGTSSSSSAAVTPTSPGPQRSPTDISLANISFEATQAARGASPPPDYSSQDSSSDSSDDSDEDGRRRVVLGERERLLGVVNVGRRSPTPAYGDVVRESGGGGAGIGGRGRSGSAPAGPSGGHAAFRVF